MVVLQSPLAPQAYEFSSPFLVPPGELAQESESGIQEAENSGLRRNHLCEECHMHYLATPIARRFDVSSGVIEQRFLKEKHWPLL